MRDGVFLVVGEGENTAPLSLTILVVVAGLDLAFRRSRVASSLRLVVSFSVSFSPFFFDEESERDFAEGEIIEASDRRADSSDTFFVFAEALETKGLLPSPPAEAKDVDDIRESGRPFLSFPFRAFVVFSMVESLKEDVELELPATGTDFCFANTFLRLAELFAVVCSLHPVFTPPPPLGREAGTDFCLFNGAVGRPPFSPDLSVATLCLLNAADFAVAVVALGLTLEVVKEFGTDLCFANLDDEA